MSKINKILLYSYLAGIPASGVGHVIWTGYLKEKYDSDMNITKRPIIAGEAFYHGIMMGIVFPVIPILMTINKGSDLLEDAGRLLYKVRNKN